MEMNLFDQRMKHAEWCARMAFEYRRDAETVPEPQRSKWLNDAARMDDDAQFYTEHAEIFANG